MAGEETCEMGPKLAAVEIDHSYCGCCDYIDYTGTVVMVTMVWFTWRPLLCVL